MLSIICGIIFKGLGWKLRGEYPVDVKKKLVVVAPHTSNWDFLIGILFRYWQKHNIKFIAKKSLFKPPLGWIAKRLGGIAVNRKQAGGFLKGVVELYNNHEVLDICITPEGTRKKVKKFKTGFYYISKNADIPILPIIFDFQHKIFDIKPLYYPSENPDEDIKTIENHYKGILGKNPENSFG